MAAVGRECGSAQLMGWQPCCGKPWQCSQHSGPSEELLHVGRQPKQQCDGAAAGVRGCALIAAQPSVRRARLAPRKQYHSCQPLHARSAALFRTALHLAGHLPAAAVADVFLPQLSCCPQKYVPLDLRVKKTRAIRRRLTKAQVGRWGMAPSVGWAVARMCLRARDDEDCWPWQRCTFGVQRTPGMGRTPKVLNSRSATARLDALKLVCTSTAVQPCRLWSRLTN